jgi:hypothetical protein
MNVQIRYLPRDAGPGTTEEVEWGTDRPLPQVGDILIWHRGDILIWHRAEYLISVRIFNMTDDEGEGSADVYIIARQG